MKNSVLNISVTRNTCMYEHSNSIEKIQSLLRHFSLQPLFCCIHHFEPLSGNCFLCLVDFIVLYTPITTPSEYYCELTIEQNVMAY